MRRYLCIGESTTSGYPTPSGYRAKLARVLGGEWEAVGPFVDAAGLRHAGFPGQPSSVVLSYAPEIARSYPADLVLVSSGLNDLPDTSPMTVGANVRAICDHFSARGAEVRALVLTDVEEMSSGVRAYNAAIAEACGRYYPLVPAGPAAGPSSRGSLYFTDTAHPSQLGYDAMADVILRDAFAVPQGIIAAAGLTTAVVSGSDLFRVASDAIHAVDPSMPTPARQIALAIGYLETGFGQSGSWAPNGVPSNNWGGLTYHEGMPGYFVHGDVDAEGNPIAGGVKFGKWPTLTEGYVAFYNTWAKADTWAAAVRGDAFGVALAMYRHHYFTCGVSPRSLCKTASEWDHAYGYAKAIMGGAEAAASSLGEALTVRLDAPPRPADADDGAPSGSTGGDFARSALILGAAAGLLYATLKIKAPKPAMVR